MRHQLGPLVVPRWPPKGQLLVGIVQPLSIDPKAGPRELVSCRWIPENNGGVLGSKQRVCVAACLVLFLQPMQHDKKKT